MGKCVDINIRVRKPTEDVQEPDANWPHLIEDDEGAITRFEIRVYDGWTKPHPTVSGRWIDVPEIVGPLRSLGTEQVDLTSSAGVFAFEAIESNWDWYINDHLVSQSVIEAEYGPDNDDRWERKPLLAVNTEKYRSPNLRGANKKWTELRDDVVNLRIELTSGESSRYDISSDLEEDGLTKGMAAKMVDEEDPDQTVYKGMAVGVPSFGLKISEVGTKALCHYYKMASDSDPEEGANCYSEWWHPETVLWSTFDTSDTDNIKVTREPDYDADEVSGKIVKGIGKITVDCFLMPRRAAFMLRHVSGTREKTGETTIVPITYVHGPGQTPMIPLECNAEPPSCFSELYHLVRDLDREMRLSDSDQVAYNLGRLALLKDSTITHTEYCEGTLSIIRCGLSGGGYFCGPYTSISPSLCTSQMIYGNSYTDYYTFPHAKTRTRHRVGLWWGRLPNTTDLRYCTEDDDAEITVDVERFFTDQEKGKQAASAVEVDDATGASWYTPAAIGDILTVTQTDPLNYEIYAAQVDTPQPRERGACTRFYADANGAVEYPGEPFDEAWTLTYETSDLSTNLAVARLADETYTEALSHAADAGMSDEDIDRIINGYNSIHHDDKESCMSAGYYSNRGILGFGDYGTLWSYVFENSEFWQTHGYPVYHTNTKVRDSYGVYTGEYAQGAQYRYAVGISPHKEGGLLAVLKVGGRAYFVWRRTDEEFEEFGSPSSNASLKREVQWEPWNYNNLVFPRLVCGLTDPMNTTKLQPFEIDFTPEQTQGVGRKITKFGRKPSHVENGEFVGEGTSYYIVIDSLKNVGDCDFTWCGARYLSNGHCGTGAYLIHSHQIQDCLVKDESRCARHFQCRTWIESDEDCLYTLEMPVYLLFRGKTA